MSYRIGIIGAGFITQTVLITAINDTDGLSLAAVLDSDRRAIEAVSRLSTNAVCTDSEEEFFSVQLDVVHVATPNNLHEHYACRALSLGMATLVEKPLADTVAAGRRIVTAHQQSVAPAMIGYMSKHNSTHRRMEALIAEGAIGPLRAMTARCLGWREGNWRNKRREAGLGSLGDLGIYPVLTAVQLFGAEPTSCQAVVWPSGDPEQTDIFADGTVWFSGERYLHLQSSFTFHEPTPVMVSEYTIVGSDGFMHVSGSWAMDGGGYIELWNRNGHTVIKPAPVNPSPEQYLLLAACSRGAPVPPAVSLERGLSDLAILCALDDSSANGGARIEFGSDPVGLGSGSRRQSQIPGQVA
jgi:predicted dehydrogenase